MSEYINKRDAIRAFTFNYKGERIPETDVDNFAIQIPVREVKKIIREILPADVQPVVHCSECANNYSTPHNPMCDFMDAQLYPDSFCSKGKRKGADNVLDQ